MARMLAVQLDGHEGGEQHDRAGQQLQRQVIAPTVGAGHREAVHEEEKPAGHRGGTG